MRAQELSLLAIVATRLDLGPRSPPLLLVLLLLSLLLAGICIHGSVDGRRQAWSASKHIFLGLSLRGSCGWHDWHESAAVSGRRG